MKKIYFYILNPDATKIKNFNGEIVYDLQVHKKWKIFVTTLTIILIGIVLFLKTKIKIFENSLLNTVAYMFIGIITEYVIMSIAANILYFRIIKRQSGDDSKPLK